MTIHRWSITIMLFVLSLALHRYCIAYVRSAWGLLSIALLLFMAFRALVDTFDLCCGRLIRGKMPGIMSHQLQTKLEQRTWRQVARVRRVILEEDVYEER